MKGEDMSKEDVPLVEKDQVREYLSKLDKHKPLGPDQMHPWVMRKLVDVAVRSPSFIVEWLLWLG